MARFYGLTLLIFLSCLTSNVLSQQIDQDYINSLKENYRGPYVGIRWFCEDGSVREARDPCPEPMEGVQHAIYADKVKQLKSNKHIFLDQILTGTEFDKFWDDANQHSRIKQYQLTNYLYSVDDGWILQKAKNYRGAKQIEDEKAWGQEFLEWACKSDSRITENFLLLKLAANDIPHGEETQLSMRIRADSKLLAELESSFMDIRTKIHNNPSEEDLQAVIRYRDERRNISPKASDYISRLIEDLETLYKPFTAKDIKDLLSKITDKKIRMSIGEFADNIEGAPSHIIAMQSSEMLPFLRSQLLVENSSIGRVAMLDLMNRIEGLVIRYANDIDDSSLASSREKLCFLKEAIYGSGYIERWEYDMIDKDLSWFTRDEIALQDFEYFKNAAQKLVLWSSQMIQSVYAEPVQLFLHFEPLARQFVDDKIRSSLILPTGQLVEQVNSFYTESIDSRSRVLDYKNTSKVVGLNPGIAKGKLEVLATLDSDTDLNRQRIYAFDRPPADMKPVAGILNVKEGNPVSHVQLLARNLGIPNALISSDLLRSLEQYRGKEIFYAVSPKGTVLIKEADEMTSAEKDMFKTAERAKENVTINTNKIILDDSKLLNLDSIDASYSGSWCGPKAANLAQLKSMYPDHVVDGFVIPFGIFKDHMDQKIPDSDLTYWQYLKQIFQYEKNAIENGKSKDLVERETLNQLGVLRSKIEQMTLKPSLIANIEQHFKVIFGASLGQVPVFLRSDTNMEDLPQFTGAGLNLTLFNVLDRNEILEGIKRVWASPYTERSYQWRQQYLNNPEEVYPSILIIPSVNVDKSGVVITKGVSRGGDEDISLSFSRGVGGAVEGQSAESYVVYKNNYAELISPGRETKYREIPSSGGSAFKYSPMTQPVLNSNERKKIYDIAQDIANRMSQLENEDRAYDIELGLQDGHIWLFQVRPFVENKNALNIDYLNSMDAKINNKVIPVQ